MQPVKIELPDGKRIIITKDADPEIVAMFQTVFEKLTREGWFK